MPKEQSKFQPIVDLLDRMESFLDAAEEPDDEEEPEPEPEPTPSKKTKVQPKSKKVEPDEDSDTDDDTDDDAGDSDGEADAEDDAADEDEITSADIQALGRKALKKTGGAEKFQKVLAKYKLKTLAAAKESQFEGLYADLNKIVAAK